MLEERKLDRKFHHCARFDCGTPELNEYLVRRASQDQRRNISQVYVLVDTGEPSQVLAYYTLSAAQVDADQITEKERRRLPRYPVPCFRMGRLAVQHHVQGEGFGKLLIGCAVDRCLQTRELVAAYALIVDAKDARAKPFYEHFGFIAFTDQPLSLYLSLGR